MKIPSSILTISIALLLWGCSKVPSGVIKPDDMAALLADVHTAEAVVDMNYSDYDTDSLKLVLRQSVYIRHGVNTAQVDSSIAWYGRHMGMYMDVYDRTIEILEHRLIETGNRIAADNALSIAGDSVDVWPNPRFLSINDRLPSRIISFSFGSDPNWEKGDAYTWRAKIFNIDQSAEWLLGVEYDDGSVEWLNDSPDESGWKDITLQTDSSLTAVRLFGYMSVVNRSGTDLRLDSISLVRKRLVPETYHRHYLINKIEHLYQSETDESSEANDSIE